MTTKPFTSPHSIKDSRDSRHFLLNQHKNLIYTAASSLSIKKQLKHQLSLSLMAFKALQRIQPVKYLPFFTSVTL